MSEKKEQKTVKVKVTLLEALITPAKKNVIKIDSLLRDHYMSGMILWDKDLTNLMELNVSSKVLVSYLEGLIEEAQEAEVTAVDLPPQEVHLMTTLIKALGQTYEIKVGNISLREH